MGLFCKKLQRGLTGSRWGLHHGSTFRFRVSDSAEREKPVSQLVLRLFY